jgi:four helix bundle protein
LQELDETGYWLKLLAESAIVPTDHLRDLLAETSELTAILVATVKSVKQRNGKS